VQASRLLSRLLLRLRGKTAMLMNCSTASSGLPTMLAMPTETSTAWSIKVFSNASSQASPAKPTRRSPGRRTSRRNSKKIALVLLNLHLTGQLRQQQTALTRQQEDLLNANGRIEAHQQEIRASAEQIKAQNDTIFQLLELSTEQEAHIREVVQTADYVKRMERRHNKHLSILSEQLSALAKEWGESIEVVRTKVQCAVQAEAFAREAAVRALEQRLTADLAHMDQRVAHARMTLTAHAETLLDLQKTAESHRLTLAKTRDEAASSFRETMGTSITGILLALMALVLMTLMR
jgi:hypothetical protein